jgi:glycosyltransferase involved in cell wall biosynthesis
MRVLHITSGNLYGGVETFLSTLLREAPATPEMETEFAVCFDGRFSAELEKVGRPPHRLPAARISRPQSVLRARRDLVELLKRRSYDVVVCHQPWACVMFASAIRSAGRPVVLWMHMASHRWHWLEYLCRLTRPDVVLCNSQFTADRASGWLRPTSLAHVYCPLSAPGSRREERVPFRRSVQTAPDDVVVVQVSRLEAFKGQLVLLGALATLKGLPRWTCWIVGGAQRAAERDYMEQLQVFAREHGIADRVRFLGERNDVHDVLSAADVYCQPNLEPEGFGLSFIEAMQARLPVVTSGIGGAREIVTEACGMLTPPGDVVTLAAELRRLIVDAGLRERLAADARRRADDLCNPSRQMRRIQTALATAMAAPSGGVGIIEADLLDGSLVLEAFGGPVAGKPVGPAGNSVAGITQHK